MSRGRDVDFQALEAELAALEGRLRRWSLHRTLREYHRILDRHVGHLYWKPGKRSWTRNLPQLTKARVLTMRRLLLKLTEMRRSAEDCLDVLERLYSCSTLFVFVEALRLPYAEGARLLRRLQNEFLKEYGRWISADVAKTLERRLAEKLFHLGCDASMRLAEQNFHALERLGVENPIYAEIFAKYCDEHGKQKKAVAVRKKYGLDRLA